MLNLLVFILALTFVTPVYLMEFLKKSGVSDTVQWVAEIHQSYVSTQLYASLAPFVLVIANYILIPQLIDKTSHEMGFRLRSSRHFSNYKKHYLSLLTNALIIPLFGLTSIETLISFLTSTATVAIEMKAIQTTNFFTRFLTGLSLFSNAINALDAPHWITKAYRKFQFRRLPAYMQLSPEKFKDTWYFD